MLTLSQRVTDTNTTAYAVTDLRTSHGLGSRANRSYDQPYYLKICETSQRNNFTIYFEASGNTNVYSRLLSAQ